MKILSSRFELQTTLSNRYSRLAGVRFHCAFLDSIFFLCLFSLLIVLFTSCHSDPLVWKPIGPSHLMGMRDFGPCAGRVDGIAFSDNYDGNATSAMYICGPGSGIWRSTNYNTIQPDWKCLTDHIFISNDAATDFKQREDINDISNIVVSPVNPRVIYAGTNNSQSVVLYSTDGGDNWSVIPASNFGNDYGVTHLFVDPDGYLYVLLNQSFWKQNSPGSVNFTNLGVPFTEPPSLPGKGPYLNFQDAVYSTDRNGHLEHIYIGVVEVNDPVASHTGLWSYDNGAWTQMPFDMVNLQGLSFFKPDIARIRMYVNNNQVVAAMTSDNSALRNLQGAFLNVYERFYNPKTKKYFWQRQWDSQTMIINTQGDHDMGTCIDHNGTIYTGGVGIAQSDGNGGVLGMPPFGSCVQCNIHVDDRVMIEYRNTIYIGTDGGVFRFNPEDHPGGSHDYISMNSPSLQNFLATTADENIYAATYIVGSQDNQMAYISAAGSQAVFYSNEDEHARFVPYVVGTPDKQIAYSYTPKNGFYKSTDGGKTFNGVTNQVPEVKGKFCLDANTPGRMLLARDQISEANGVKSVTHTVIETKNHWLSSQNIMGGLQNVRAVTAMCYARDLIIVATGTTILISNNDGVSWHIPWTSADPVIAICWDQSSPNSIYLATSSTNAGGRVFHCLLPADPAQAWKLDDLTGNIPGAVTNLNILYRGSGKWPYLFASLANGQIRTAVGGPGLYEGNISARMKKKTANWKIVGKGLPDAEIRDIQVIPHHAGSGKVIVATYGRGAWEMEVGEN